MNETIDLTGTDYEYADPMLQEAYCDGLHAANGSVVIPDTVGLITLDADSNWEVEFWYQVTRMGCPEWEDMQGDYLPIKFALASRACEMSKLQEWVAWDIYRDYFNGGWAAYVQGETNGPEGHGEGPVDALRDALAKGKS